MSHRYSYCKPYREIQQQQEANQANLDQQNRTMEQMPELVVWAITCLLARRPLVGFLLAGRLLVAGTQPCSSSTLPQVSSPSHFECFCSAVPSWPIRLQLVCPLEELALFVFLIEIRSSTAEARFVISLLNRPIINHSLRVRHFFQSSPRSGSQFNHPRALFCVQDLYSRSAFWICDQDLHLGSVFRTTPVVAFCPL